MCGGKFIRKLCVEGLKRVVRFFRKAKPIKFEPSCLIFYLRTWLSCKPQELSFNSYRDCVCVNEPKQVNSTFRTFFLLPYVLNDSAKVYLVMAAWDPCAICFFSFSSSSSFYKIYLQAFIDSTLNFLSDSLLLIHLYIFPDRIRNCFKLGIKRGILENRHYWHTFLVLNLKLQKHFGCVRKLLHRVIYLLERNSIDGKLKSSKLPSVM